MDTAVFPLTPAARGFYEVHCHDSAGTALVIGETITFHGPINIELLAHAIAWVIDMTEVESMWVTHLEGEPFFAYDKRWAPVVEIRRETVDVQAAIVHDMSTPMDVHSPGIARHIVWDIPSTLEQTHDPSGPDKDSNTSSLTDSRHVIWYRRSHHMFYDGYALFLFARKVLDRYAYVAGSHIAPEPWAITYQQAAEHACRVAQEAERHRDFWYEKLQGLGSPPSVGLCDPPRWDECPPRAIRCLHTVDPNRFIAFQNVCEKKRIHWADWIFACVTRYIVQQSSSLTVQLSISQGGRLANPYGMVPCCLVNEVPLVITDDPELSLAQLAAKISQIRKQDRPYSNYRGEKLREELAEDRGHRRIFGPIVNIMVSDYSSGIPGVRTQVDTPNAGPVEDFAVHMYVRGVDEGLDVAFDGQANVYTPEHVHLIADDFYGFLIDHLQALIASESPNTLS